jgi:molecular chaperone IbpA
MFNTTSLIGRQGDLDSIFKEADKIFGKTDEFLSALEANPVGVFRHNSGKYPPYNVVSVDGDSQVIELAVAGFKKEEITITTDDGKLTVSGSHGPLADNRKFVVKGISERDFSIVFNLPKYFEVSGSTLVDGILTISLVKNVPEALKPKTIAID